MNTTEVKKTTSPDLINAQIEIAGVLNKYGVALIATTISGSGPDLDKKYPVVGFQSHDGNHEHISRRSHITGGELDITIKGQQMELKVSEELKPCPFCGGEARSQMFEGNWDSDSYEPAKVVISCESHQCLIAPGIKHYAESATYGYYDVDVGEAYSIWNKRSV